MSAPSSNIYNNRRQDTSFIMQDWDVVETVGNLVGEYGLDSLSKVDIKWDTINKVDDYNNLVDSFVNLTSDIQFVNRLQTELKDRTILPTLDVETVAPVQTTIISTSGYLMQRMSHFLPEAKKSLSDEDYSNYTSSLAGLIWIYSNVSNRKKSPFKFQSDEEMQLYNDVVDKLDKIIETVDQGGLKPDPADRDAVRTAAVHKEYPKILEFYSKYRGVFENTDKICQAISSSASEFAQVTKSLGNASAELMDWGDLKNNPFGVLLNVINGVASLYVAQLGMCNAVLNCVNRNVSALSDLFGIEDDEKSQKKVNKMTPIKAISNIVLSLGSIITSIGGGLFQMISAAFSASFTLFTTILRSILTLSKSIAETSEVFKAILKYVDLAMTMFFLPFWTAFAEPLLDVLMTAYTEILEYGQRFIDYFQNADEDMKNHITTSLKELFTYIKQMLVEGMEVLVDVITEVLPKLLEFTGEVIDWLTDNKDTIVSFIEKGLSAMTTLVERAIGTFLTSGSKWFAFLITKSPDIVKLINNVLKIVNKLLKVGEWGLNHAKTASYALLTTTGAIVGAVLGRRIGTILALFTAGTSLIWATAIGAGAGAATGITAAHVIYDKYLEPGIKLAKEFQTADVKSLSVDEDAIKALNITSSDLPEFAKGGKIYGVQGGHIGLLGEAGQGEFAIPQSKMKLFRGNNNIILRFNKGLYNQKQVEPILRELQTEVDFDYIFE